MRKSDSDSSGSGPEPGAGVRRSARSAVLLSATIDCGGVSLLVRVINLSAHGALVQGDSLPDEDQRIIFRCGGENIPGRMAWVRPPLGGISFESAIKPEAIRRKSQSGSQLVTKDLRKLDFRRPGFRGNQMSDEERAIVENWIREQTKD